MSTIAPGVHEAPTVKIGRTRGWRLLDIRELWEYRELNYYLTLREIKVRYKQTVVGIAWALLQPVGMMVIFTVVFDRIANLPSDGVPYPLFAFSALLPWQLFARILNESSSSLIADQRLITRVYFPRIIVPTASATAALLDFLIGCVLLAGLMAWYGVAPGLEVLAVPGFMLLMMVSALGVGYWLSALNLEYRDVRYMIPFLSQAWLFATPVFYSSTLVPDRWQLLYGINPSVGVITGMRWSLLGTPAPSLPMLAISVGIALFLFLSGILWFRSREKTFADAVGSGGR